MERNLESGEMEIKVATNHGRFIVATSPIVVNAFYDHVAQIARRDIAAILTEEQSQMTEESNESRSNDRPEEGAEES